MKKVQKEIKHKNNRRKNKKKSKTIGLMQVIKWRNRQETANTSTFADQVEQQISTL